MTTTILPDGAAKVATAEALPFAVLRLSEATNRARREAGKEIARGTLTIERGQARCSGAALAEDRQQALALALVWLGSAVDGVYSLHLHRAHRAVVEVDGDGLHVDESQAAGKITLALAWAGALLAAAAGDVRAALRKVGQLYIALSADDRAAVQAALADGAVDAGNLCAIYLQRVARETNET